MRLKKLFLFTFLFIVSTLFLGCVLEDESAEDNATATGSGFSADETVYINLTDKTYSLDWLAPAGIPLFVGAEAHNINKAAFC